MLRNCKALFPPACDRLTSQIKFLCRGKAESKLTTLAPFRQKKGPKKTDLISFRRLEMGHHKRRSGGLVRPCHSLERLVVTQAEYNRGHVGASKKQSSYTPGPSLHPFLFTSPTIPICVCLCAYVRVCECVCVLLQYDHPAPCHSGLAV